MSPRRSVDGLAWLDDHQVAAYLARIGWAGATGASTTTLFGLQRGHMLHIPFESYDCALGRPVRVDPIVSLAKIVDRHRGGFCYELNLPFGSLLRTLGYEVELLGCRPFLQLNPETFEPEGTHVAMRVTVDGQRWLVDVGYGDVFLEPLAFDDPAPQVREEGRAYSVVPAGHPRSFQGRATMIPEFGGDDREAFDLAPGWTVDDFAARCLAQSTDPESWFVATPTCTMATGSGRVSMVARSRLISRIDGLRTVPHALAPRGGPVWVR